MISCGEFSDKRLTCSREVVHDGPHVATGSTGRVYQVWEQAPKFKRCTAADSRSYNGEPPAIGCLSHEGHKDMHYLGLLKPARAEWVEGE